MSELVERLREWHADGFGEIHKEAADEIERLQAQIGTLMAQIRDDRNIINRLMGETDPI